MGRANVVCEYAMNRTNAIYDTRIGYARYANRLREICEYAMGRANAICNTRIDYAL